VFRVVVSQTIPDGYWEWYWTNWATREEAQEYLESLCGCAGHQEKTQQHPATGTVVAEIKEVA